jgi:purine nucleosidase/pyrimidine-specific ribonucleoside hydrolase
VDASVFVGDPGIDDAIAWAVAAAHPACRAEAVVAGVGNVDARVAWRNAVGLADLVGWHVPVGMGAATALDGHRPPRADDPVHGPDGLGGSSGRLAQPQGEPPDGLPLVRGSVVATGPLTDVARAVRAGQPVEQVVWMGGSLDGRGNVSPTAEFNAWADAGAADEVLASGLAVTVVPLDVTRQIRLLPVDIERWAAGPPVARFCADIGAYRMRHDGAPLHDPVAIIALVEPELFRWEHVAVRCETDGDRRGSLMVTIASGPQGPTVRVATAVDAAAVHDRIVGLVLG